MSSPKGYASDCDAFESPKPEFSVLHQELRHRDECGEFSRSPANSFKFSIPIGGSLPCCCCSLSAVQLFLGSIGNCASFTEARFAPARSSNSPRKDIPRSHIETLDWKYDATLELKVKHPREMLEFLTYIKIAPTHNRIDKIPNPKTQFENSSLCLFFCGRLPKGLKNKTEAARICNLFAPKYFVK